MRQACGGGHLPQSAVALLFTLVFVTLPLRMLVAGRIPGTQGSRATGCRRLVYGVSWPFAGFANFLLSLYIIYGVLGVILGALLTFSSMYWMKKRQSVATL